VDEPDSNPKATRTSSRAANASIVEGEVQPRPATRSADRPPRKPRVRTPGLPGAGPGLPPTAQRLLDASRRLLARSGYNSLTVEAIGREAGENKALIRYYFGSKNGLLVALVDGLVSDTLWQARQRLAALSSLEDRAGLVVDTLGAILADATSYRLLYDLLPRLLENPAMARQLAELYRAYRDLNTRALWGDRAEEAPIVVRDVAAMSVALTDGLAVQLLAEPGSVDVASTLAAWRSFVEGVLASTAAPDRGTTQYAGAD
jgi:AcrR family transcriptional regulator